MEVVNDAYTGQPLRLILGSQYENIDHNAKWSQRRRQLNRLLSRSRGSHLIRIQQSGYDTFLAGKKGISMRVALEYAAVESPAIQNGVVVIPLDESFYWARLEDGVLMEEHCVAKLLEAKIEQWEREGRSVVYTAGGLQSRNLPRVLQELDLQLDIGASEFVSARTMLLQQRMFRNSDIWVLCILALAGMGAFYWQPIYEVSTNALKGLRGNVPEPVVQTIVLPDFRQDAYRRIHSIAEYLSNDRLAFYSAFGMDLVRFNPATHAIESEAPYDQLAWSRLQKQTRENPNATTTTNYVRFSFGETLPPLPPRDAADEHLGVMNDTLDDLFKTFSVLNFPGESTPPYPLEDGRTLECIVNVAPPELNAAQLFLFAHRLKDLPLQLDRFECALADGKLQSCRIGLMARGVDRA